jgi:hypothetical protein
MALADWGIATGTAASVLILEEGRKLIAMLLERLRSGTLPAASS